MILDGVVFLIFLFMCLIVNIDYWGIVEYFGCVVMLEVKEGVVIVSFIIFICNGSGFRF